MRILQVIVTTRNPIKISNLYATMLLEFLRDAEHGIFDERPIALHIGM
jgi:hypothetical protein